MGNSQDLQKACFEMRLNLLMLAHNASDKGAHIASSLSEIEILANLYLSVMNLENDIFVLSKGHGGLGYYTALHQAGFITFDQLQSFETEGGDFPGQPSKNRKYGIEYSSGSLGMGLSYAIGLALSKKIKNEKGNVYVLLGDGECNEGSVWEAAMFAAANKLDNLVAIVDYNRMQSDASTAEVMSCNLPAIWKSNNWFTVETDGHDLCQLDSAFQVIHIDKPLVVIASTIKGKGVSFMENDNKWHHNRLSDTDYENAVKEVSRSYYGN